METLFNSENFLNLISAHLPDMLWAKDVEGRYLFANKSICENLLMAKNPQEAIGKTDIFFALRERAKYPNNPNWHTFGELCFNSDEETLKVMKPMRFEEFGNIKGEMVYLEVHKAPFYDENGKLIGVIGSGRDITEQKKLECELEITKRLIESGPVVVFEWSGEDGWPIRFVSPNVTSVLGIDYKKLLNKEVKFSNFVHPEDLPEVSKEVEDYIKNKTQMFSQEYRLLKENGTIIWIKDFTIVEYNDDFSIKMIKGYVFDNTAEILAKEKAYHLNNFDRLTGLPNRQKMALDIISNEPKGCAIFNISSFREINDFFGIDVGDEVLIQLADEFKRMGVQAYRIGGDEFAILCYEEANLSAVEEKVTQMLHHFHDMIFIVANENINVRFNVGIAMGVQKLLTRADIALHLAKEKKLSVAIYKEKENIEEMYKKNIALASQIHQALNENRIICYYQPIIDFKTGQVSKYETLVRMIDEDENIIAPIEFLPIAKKTKLYPRITREVIKQACNCFQDKNIQFSVNLSVDDINDPYTVQEIIKTIIKTNTANKIIFELLESEGIENYASVSDFSTQVKALGAKIAIDDFGTGYSNFEHILKLNIDFIKIDGSLIRAITTNSRHKIIVETILEFAKKIGVGTVAEFVSDGDIYDMVQKIGIDFAQGYYTGKPMPLE